MSSLSSSYHPSFTAAPPSSLSHTLWFGLDERAVAFSFGLLVLLGELTRWSGPESREAAPLAAAGALSYALLGEDAGRATHHGALQVVSVVVAATLVGCVPHVARRTSHVARGRPPTISPAACSPPASPPSASNPSTTRACSRPGAVPAPSLPMAPCSSRCSGSLRSATPYSLLRDELRAVLGIGTAVCATGVVMALAVGVVGLWALPVFSLPLLLTQFAFRRYAAVRATYRQTIASLARATEIAGYTPAGHARRVAVLSRAVGRELGLSEAELTVLEYAALMHDIGQLSLVDPVPAGATAVLPVAEQRRIALLGGAVVRRTGVASAVAVVVERQADPYREQPISACVVRAVNAYEEMVRDAGAGGPLHALEELRLGTGRDYRPEVVESLARVLARNGGVVHERIG